MHLFQTLNCSKSFSVSLPLYPQALSPYSPSTFSVKLAEVLFLWKHSIYSSIWSIDEFEAFTSMRGHPPCLLPKCRSYLVLSSAPEHMEPRYRPVLGCFCSPAGWAFLRWSLWARWLWTALPEPSPGREPEKVPNIPQGLGTWHL